MRSWLAFSLFTEDRVVFFENSRAIRTLVTVALVGMAIAGCVHAQAEREPSRMDVASEVDVIRRDSYLKESAP